MARLASSDTTGRGVKDTDPPRSSACQSRNPLSRSSNIQPTPARHQRPLAIQHVNSLLLPIPTISSKPSLATAAHWQPLPNPRRPRTTPRRRAKRQVDRSAEEDESEDDTARDLADGEWKGSEYDSSDGGSTDGSSSSWEDSISPAKSRVSRRPKAEFRMPTGPYEDLRGLDTADGKVKPMQWDSKLPQDSLEPVSPSDESGAILRYSPPGGKPLSKMKPLQRPATPPPPQSPAPSRLTSPKKLQRIPPTPHRPSIDAFWSADVINEWNDEYSPKKTLKSSRKAIFSGSNSERGDSTPSGSPRKNLTKREPSKDSKSRIEAKRAFDRSKSSIAESFLEELDQKVAEGEISRLAASTGGVKLIWSKKLNSTAGRAHWRRERADSSDVAASVPELKNRTAATDSIEHRYKHHASIELAEKVIDDQTRLLNVLAHEYCHLANFMISGVKDQPHGASFKRWAKLASNAFSDRDVVVTTKHSYEIKYKYAWACCNSDCGVEYARHSRSIDPKRHTCGKCRGTLKQIRPVPRKGAHSNNVQGDGAKPEYQRFVKEQFAVVRSELGPKSPMKELMTEIGARYRTRKNAVPCPGVNAAGELERSERQSTLLVDDAHEDDSRVLRRDLTEGKAYASIEDVALVLDFLTIGDEIDQSRF